MKVTNVEIGGIDTWYSVEVENDPDKAMSQGNYSICDQYDPDDEASYIIKACRNASIVQQNWKK